jgi:hypothetical protein
MMDIMPAENMQEALRVAREADEFGRAHYDGGGWTEMYIIPESKQSISERNIPLSDIDTLVSGRLEEAKSLFSGIRPGELVLERCFAFGDDHLGALYGYHVAEVIGGLHFLPPEDHSTSTAVLWHSILATLGQRYQLILADWWSPIVIDLSDGRMIDRYLRHLRGER